MIGKKPLNIAFLSTIPPRECGLATFTQDLIDAIDESGAVNTYVIAVNNKMQRKYGSKVICEINQNCLEDYLELPDKLDSFGIDLVVIEHEFGIYGGEYGEYILEFLRQVEIPVITTLHTVLKNPNKKQKAIITELGKKSSKIVTMAKNTKSLLHTLYEIPSDKIRVIHHGVPFQKVLSRQELKEKNNFSRRQIVSTFGLLSPGKGIEYAIQAIKKIKRENNEILYLILGQTHPDQKDESYRRMLEGLVLEYQLSDNVKFINKYLSKTEIINYLQMSDIYMTPYLSKEQAVSGTLAYAVGYGRAIISTPYLYAQEMLAEGRGVLAESESADSLFYSLRYILQNPDKKREMEIKTMQFGKSMYWSIVGQSYMELFFEEVRLGKKLGVMIW